MGNFFERTAMAGFALGAVATALLVGGVPAAASATVVPSVATAAEPLPDIHQLAAVGTDVVVALPVSDTELALLDPDTGAPANPVDIGVGVWALDAGAATVTLSGAAATEHAHQVRYAALGADGLPGTAATIDVQFPWVGSSAVSQTQPQLATWVTPRLGSSMDPTTVHLIDPETGAATVAPVVVAGEGTWSIDTSRNEIAFAPAPELSGSPVPISYTAQDTDGNFAAPAPASVDYGSTAEPQPQPTAGVTPPPNDGSSDDGASAPPPPLTDEGTPEQQSGTADDSTAVPQAAAPGELAATGGSGTLWGIVIAAALAAGGVALARRARQRTFR